MNKGTLKVVRGDVTTPQFTAPDEIAVVTHVCNNTKGWGAGFVLALSKKDNNPKDCYQNMFRKFTIPKDKNKMLGLVSFASFCSSRRYQEYDGLRSFDGYMSFIPKIIIANMIAQDGVIGYSDYEIPLRYSALIKCMQFVADWINERTNPEKYVIHTPKFGSDLAGGNWYFILDLIREQWLDCGIDVVVYEFESDKDKFGEVHKMDVVRAEEVELYKRLKVLEGLRVKYTQEQMRKNR